MSLRPYGYIGFNALALDLLDHWSVDIAPIGQDHLRLLPQIVADRFDHRLQFIVIGRVLANVGSYDELTAISIDSELRVVSLAKSLVFTLAHDATVGIGQIALV